MNTATATPSGDLAQELIRIYDNCSRLNRAYPNLLLPDEGDHAVVSCTYTPSAILGFVASRSEMFCLAGSEASAWSFRIQSADRFENPDIKWRETVKSLICGALFAPGILCTSNTQGVSPFVWLNEPSAEARQGARSAAHPRMLGIMSSAAADALTTEEHLATVPAEVERFCADNGLIGHLKSGILLARKHFSGECQIRLYVDTDPEDGDEYVVLEVNSSRDPAVDLESQVHYLEEWSASVGWPASRMILLDVRSTD
jgi:hypothetical protein